MNPPIAFVGRQPIFAKSLEVHAYELLFRDSLENRARFDDANRAAATTLLSAFVELGIDRVAGDRPVFVNLPLDFVVGRLPLPFPPDRVVIEVLEDVPATPEVLAALRAYREQGYRVALDDFVLGPTTCALLEVADIVKLDVVDLAAVRAGLPAVIAACRGAGAEILAEKVETRADFDELRALGFDYYQGYFLERPVVIQGRRLTAGAAAAVRLLASLHDPRADVRAIERLLAGDVGLAYRVVRLASAAAVARGAPVTTIGQAVQRLGLQKVAALALLVIASGLSDRAPALIEQATIRARAGELLAHRLGMAPEHLMTAGLFSVLDALLDVSMADALAGLPLAPEVSAALRDHTGPLAPLLDAVRALERGDLAPCAALGLATADVSAAWLDALAWSRGLRS